MPRSTSTTFPSIDVIISHDWIDDSIVLSSTRKADKAPVPASLWNKRLMASFPDEKIDVEMLSLFRKVALSRCRINIRRSLVAYLRCRFPVEWLAYLQGYRDAKNGGRVNSMHA